MDPTKKQIQEASAMIIETLISQSENKEGADLVFFIYNSAINDAANYASDMAKTNPTRGTTLQAISRDIRRLLTLQQSEES